MGWFLDFNRLCGSVDSFLEPLDMGSDVLMIQLHLSSENAEMVCCVPYDKRLKEGINIYLKEIPDIVWTIRYCYDGLIPKNQIQRGWNVGGL